MSSIWTPGGEHEVPRPGQPAPQAQTEPAGEAEREPELTAEERARLEDAAREVAAVRAQLAAAPPEQVVANHVIGLYELAAIHLSQAEPDLPASRLAIDALGAVLDACRGRLGEAEATLASARSQIQLAFVAASHRPGGGPGAAAHGPSDEAQGRGDAGPGAADRPDGAAEG